MANQSVLELAVGTGKWDAGLKKAVQSLNNFTQANGGLTQALNSESQKMQQFVSMMGNMESSAKTAKGQMNDYKSAIEQLTMQYNRLTGAQKESFGSSYTATIDQLKVKYQAVNKELQEMTRSLNDMPTLSDGGGGGIFSKMGDKLGGAMSVFAGNLMTKATMEVANLGSEMANMVKQGVEMAKAGEGIRIAFERLGNGQILDGLREATHGTVTDIELMKAAVKFNDFKLPIEELGTMLAFAQQKAKDTGQSVDYMVDSIVTGLGRKSLMILDNLGLSATEIKDKMAETGDMTKAVGAIIREQMQKAGDYVETAADRAAQANVDLQNKLEELGRKFLPVQEASNQLWTSMKIGILDIVGGPLARLLNGLTEAGRLRNQMNDMAGGNSSSETEKQLNFLRKTSPANRQQRYDKQLGIYNAQESNEWRRANRAKANLDKLKNAKPGTYDPETYASLKDSYQAELTDATRKAQAWQNFRINYQKGAQGILNPPKVEPPKVEPPKTGGNGGGTSGKSGSTPADDIAKAEANYAATMNMAQRDLMENVITQKKYDETIFKGQQDLANAYNKAYEATGDEKYLKAYQETAAHVTEMQGVIDSNIEAQKESEKAARELANAQRKLTDAQNELADAQASGDLKKIYAAEKKVETAQVQVDARTSTSTGEQKAVEVPITISNLDALKQHLTEEMATTPVGDSLLQNMQEAFSDASAIGSIFSTAVKNGIDTATFDTSGIMQKLLNGENIGDDTIQEYVDQLNKLLKEKFDETEWPKVAITFDVKTKEITNLAKQQEQHAKKLAQDWSVAGQAINAVGNAMSQIEDPAIKVMGTIAQAVASVALGAAQAIASPKPWPAWIAFAAAATATMISTISSIHSATGYAEGGIVDGSKGGFIQGNTYSGDQIGNVRLNAGELVLNRAQQGALADALDNEGGGAISSTPYVTGEQIFLGLNNYLKGAGYGQLVTSNS